LSGITPILRKVNTRELTVHFTCPVILGFKYAAIVIFTMNKQQLAMESWAERYGLSDIQYSKFF